MAALLLNALRIDAAQAKAATQTKAHKPAATRSRLVVIDPGHGGIDPGAIGQSGLMEKQVVLDIAQACGAELRRIVGADVRFTRVDDRFIELGDRVSFAQSLKADLFVSVHADSAPDAGARGLSIYTLSDKASDRLAAALADHENRSDTLYGVDLHRMDHNVASILLDLARRDTYNRSLALQHDLVADLDGKTRLLEHPARAANFAVLRSPEVPAVLIENGFLSNRNDEALLATPRYRQTLGRLLAHSLARTVELTEPA